MNANEADRNVIGQPDLVFGPIEQMRCAMHRGCVNLQHDGFAIAGADGAGGCDIGREMHVMASLPCQAFRQDPVQIPGRGSVKQDRFQDRGL